VNQRRLRATTVAGDALAVADLCIVGAGTPSASNGSLSMHYVEVVIGQIGRLLASRSTPLPVVVRSTLLPGTMRSLVKESGGPPGEKFEALFHPELLREGTSLKGFHDTPKIAVGELVPGTGQTLFELYRDLTAPSFVSPTRSQKSSSCSDNIFHALRSTFADEIGHFCHAHGIDSREVMEVFCSDTRLNLSPRYLRPGFAFGGSCLRKNLRAFLHAANMCDVNTPLLSTVLPRSGFISA
jgi:GDP-mannose 6-dehydrogenase